MVKGDVTVNITVDPATARLVADPMFRRAARGVLQPVESAGSDASVEIQGGDADEVLVPGDQAWFDAETVDQLHVSTTRMTLTLVKVVLEGRAAWTFRYGDARMNIPVEDEAFLERMDRREFPIVPGIRLGCDVEVTEQEQADGGIKVTRRIVRVVGWSEPGEQLRAFD